VRAPWPRAWSVATRITPPPPPVSTPTLAPMNDESLSISVEMRLVCTSSRPTALP